MALVTKSKKKNKNGSIPYKALGKLALQATGNGAIIPYVNQLSRGARLVSSAYDTFSGLMSHFQSSNSPPNAGGPSSMVAGVSNAVQVARNKPKFMSTQGTVRILHKELVCPVFNTTTIGSTPRFSTSESSIFQVNVGSGNAFPWLSQIAANYDSYRFRRLRIVYVPLCPTSEAGRVTLCYDVDSTDAIPLDRQALSNYSCSSEGAPWALQALDCRLTDTNKWYYTDSDGAQTSSGAVNAMLDQGQFFAVTYSGSSSNQIGELYALYDVELRDPQPSSASVFRAAGVVGSIIQAFPSNAPVFMQGATTNSLVLSFPVPGRYLINIIAQATSAGSLSSSANGTILTGDGKRVNNGSETNTTVMYSVTGSTTLTYSALTGLNNWVVFVTRSPIFPTIFF